MKTLFFLITINIGLSHWGKATKQDPKEWERVWWGWQEREGPSLSQAPLTSDLLARTFCGCAEGGKMAPVFQFPSMALLLGGNKGRPIK